MRRRPTGLRSTRKSRSFYPVKDPQLQRRMRAVSFEGYYTFLLHQDLEFVIPYEHDVGERPTARIVGPDADRAEPLITQALTGALDTVNHDSVRRFRELRRTGSRSSR